MSAEPNVPVAAAPRNIDGLVKITPFKLRILAQSLGGLESPEQKHAWHTTLSTQEARAGYVLDLLTEHDRKNGGPPAPPPPPVVQPMAMPAPAEVAPAALAAAAAAAVEKPRARRSPATATADAAPAVPPPPADLGTDILNLLAKVAAGTEANTNALGAFDRRVVNVLNEQAERIARLEALTMDLAEKLKASQQLQTWTLTAFLTFMQESMQASTADLVSAAIADSAQLEALVKQATGKG